MQVNDYIAVIRGESAALADSADLAGLDAAVPYCPGWQVRDVVQHTGGVQRWATAYVARGRVEPFDDEEEAAFFTDPEDEALVAWFRTGGAALADTLASADPDLAAFQFLPAASPRLFWARRQAHEVAIHRADADAAAGRASAYDPAFAADGIAELISCFHARSRSKLVADPPVSLSVRATDADCAWTIRIEPAGRVITPEALEADCALTGPASDLYLALWNRRSTDGIDLRGDASVFDLWRERSPITW